MNLRRFSHFYYFLKITIPAAAKEHKDPRLLQPEIRSDVDAGGTGTVQTLEDRNVLLIF